MERTVTQRTNNRFARRRWKFVPITASDGARYCAFLKRGVADIIDQHGRTDPSTFVINCVLALSQVLNGPERFGDALRWLTDGKWLGKRSTAIEVSIMYWAGQHDVGIG